VYLMHF